MCAKCMICQENEATKTNSHVIPSFLVTMFTSYNGSGKRDTEVLFSISDTFTFAPGNKFKRIG